MALDAIANIFKHTGEIAILCINYCKYMVEHSCEYFLTAQGMITRDVQAFLSPKDIPHTVRYTAENTECFKQIN